MCSKPGARSQVDICSDSGSRHRDNSNPRKIAAQSHDGFESFAFRHHDVRENNVGRLGAQPLDPFEAVPGSGYGVSLGLKQNRDGGKHRFVVVDNQNSRHEVNPAAAGQQKFNRSSS